MLYIKCALAHTCTAVLLSLFFFDKQLCYYLLIFSYFLFSMNEPNVSKLFNYRLSPCLTPLSLSAQTPTHTRVMFLAILWIWTFDEVWHWAEQLVYTVYCGTWTWWCASRSVIGRGCFTVPCPALLIKKSIFYKNVTSDVTSEVTF